ncbi:phosphotransferase family protein [Pandoraea terrae]|uniref:Phosphotransferase family protein n=1 Tax=Pandoraea terrae TaxID=1537710 RepID=A0A5E4U6J4_9BURK|nr:phosphotransferase family protein [Pandoraea terrae]VVD94688.1 phosphotransferase family protein [Pandoraea terrae]
MTEIDFGAVTRWMDSAGLPGGPVEDVQPIGGGTQNVMLRFRRGGSNYVLRRGPRHLRPHSNDALRREIRVLESLSRTEVPCPQIVAACKDEQVLGGAVFYLMKPVDGFNATVALPDLHASDAAVRHAMGYSAVDALAALHAVDHERVGLGDLGRPEGFLTRQVARWLGELESYKRHDGYPGSELPAVAEIADWLEARVPTSWTPGIVHGDFHLANLMFAQDSPAVAAIVDWEMCTIGDPLLDLGWLLATWPDSENPSPAAAHVLGAAGGLPAPAELIERYTARSTRDLTAIDWYTVLACFKLGIVLEGTHARACAGKADKATGDLLHRAAVGLLQRAEAIIAGARTCWATQST